MSSKTLKHSFFLRCPQTNQSLNPQTQQISLSFLYPRQKKKFPSQKERSPNGSGDRVINNKNSTAGYPRENPHQDAELSQRVHALPERAPSLAPDRVDTGEFGAFWRCIGNWILWNTGFIIATCNSYSHKVLYRVSH